MTALTLNNLLDLVPGEVYTEKTDPNSNVYKALQVKQQIFSDLMTIAEQIRLLKDISTISGYSLDLWAADYKLYRDGNTDAEFRVRLATKISAGEYGITIPGIIKTLSKFVNPLANLMITERSNSSLGVLWDGTHNWDGSVNWGGAGAIRWRTFDISLDFFNGISDPVIGAAVDKMKDNIKGAGITATVEYF